MDELCLKPATELARLVRTREVSAVELLDTHLARIDACNPDLNAIVTLVPERARALAEAVDQRLTRGEATGALGGLPIAHKDLLPTAGIRTTMGSPIFANHVPETDALIVTRMREAGAVTIGKTNVPEFGAGSQTFNRVFGATRNPYDTSRTCGGSSGGAGVALATGMVPIADGSDMGGSLRNPGNFCNVVGFRPSGGRVPSWPGELGWFTIPVLGPMARTVADAALLLSVMAGPDPRVPAALDEAGATFAQDLGRDFKDVRVALSTNFGHLPVDPEVRQVIAGAAPVLESLGCIVEEGCPDFEPADSIFKTLRAWSFAHGHRERIRTRREDYKDTIIWNVEAGLELTGEDVANAEAARTALFQKVQAYLAEREFLILPVSQVPPFPIDTEWVQEIDGVTMETYIDWMKSCYYISAIGLPAISVPCGFTASGLPVGLQIVGRHHADLSVLQLAHAFEAATQMWKRHPSGLPDNV